MICHNEKIRDYYGCGLLDRGAGGGGVRNQPRWGPLFDKNIEDPIRYGCGHVELAEIFQFTARCSYS